MHRDPIKMPKGLTPEAGYALLMRRGAYYMAARVARDHSLGASLVIEAAFKAFCRFDDLGLDEEALIVAEEFGLTVMAVEMTVLADAVRAAQLLRLPDLPTTSARSGSGLPN